MAYRELGMVELREIVRRWLRGDGIRAIARATGMDRKTIAAYMRAAVAAGVQRGGPPPTDEQLAAIGAARRPGRRPNTLAPSPELHAVRPHEAAIRQWLAEGLRLTKIYRRLRAQGVAVSYSSLYRFARAACDFGTPAVTVRVADPPPGEAAEIDFGRLGLWLDPATGRRRAVYGLLVTLCFSRYAFLWVALRQDLSTVLEGLEAAWVFFGGVVRRLVEDNLKPVVLRPDRYDPHVQRVFLEYAQYRGFVVDPAVPDHARGKPKVERGIPYAREDFFRGETFHDLADMRHRALLWSRDLAGTRVHGTTRQVPRVVFETVEQPTLRPLAPEPFDRPVWAWATVHRDHHIELRRACIHFAQFQNHPDIRRAHGSAIVDGVDVFGGGMVIQAQKRRKMPRKVPLDAAFGLGKGGRILVPEKSVVAVEIGSGVVGAGAGGIPVGIGHGNHPKRKKRPQIGGLRRQKRLNDSKGHVGAHGFVPVMRPRDAHNWPKRRIARRIGNFHRKNGAAANGTPQNMQACDFGMRCRKRRQT